MKQFPTSDVGVSSSGLTYDANMPAPIYFNLVKNLSLQIEENWQVLNRQSPLSNYAKDYIKTSNQNTIDKFKGPIKTV